MNLTWKPTLRTPSSERFLALHNGQDAVAVSAPAGASVNAMPGSTRSSEASTTSTFIASANPWDSIKAAHHKNTSLPE